MAQEEINSGEDREPVGAADLQRIDTMLAKGLVEPARSLAAQLLSTGVDRGSQIFAEATYRLACSDLALSRTSRALESATEAASLFQAMGDGLGEVSAFSLVAIAAARLGRPVDAIEAALTSIALAKQLPSGVWAAQAYLGLGHAYASAQGFAQAQQAFEEAAHIAARHSSPQSVGEVRVAQALTEVMRLLFERDETRSIGDLGVLRRFVDRIGAFGDDGAMGSLTPGGAAETAHFASLLSEGLKVWSTTARVDTEDVLSPCDIDAGASQCALALSRLVECERAMTLLDFDTATRCAADMIVIAGHAEHAALAQAAHLAASHALERNGAFEEALNVVKRSRLLERTQRLHTLASRAEQLPLHLALRETRQAVLELTAQSRAFELLAFEDTLTGIANFRRFKQRLSVLEASVRDTGEPLCAAFIDVNSFKWVNDTFLHDVGDEVLKTIASIITAHVREVDLAARLHGDEFAILFRNIDEAEAARVCQRIRIAVRTHPWNDLAEGLKVSISLGVVQAQPGDTAEQLIKRSDDAMYADKRQRNDARQASVPVPRLSTTLLERVATWIERAERMVVFVGAEQERDHIAISGIDGLSGWTAAQRQQYGHVDGFWADQRGFLEFWSNQKRQLALKEPTPAHRLLVELSAMGPETTFVTERIDGVLAKAGAGHVIELFGNAFRTRCLICGQPSAVVGVETCSTCDRKGTAIAPDVVFIGESTSGRLSGGAELAAKRADVILVVGSDAGVFPGASLLDKARVRGARVVMLGEGASSHANAVDVSILGPDHEALTALIERLRSGNPDPAFRHELSDEGFTSLCFLSGSGTDHRGRTLEQILSWDDRQIRNHSDATQWQFPLLTRSEVCPDAPVPTEADFARFAADETVKAAVRKSYCRMLLHFGFEWTDGRVVRAKDWEAGFGRWSHLRGTDNLRISRILGSLTLCGMNTEANAFLMSLYREVPWVRAHDRRGPMRFWEAAVRPRPGPTHETVGA